MSEDEFKLIKGEGSLDEPLVLYKSDYGDDILISEDRRVELRICLSAVSFGVLRIKGKSMSLKGKILVCPDGTRIKFGK